MKGAIGFPPSIEFCRLYERESARGTKYLVGRLGRARISLLPGDPTEDGTPTWRLLIQQPPPKTEASERPRQGALDARSPVRQPRSQAPSAAANGEGDTAPFFSDSVDDLYREAGR
jgi:hypothetical protein